MEECRGAERLEGTPCRLLWWQQILDYKGEEEGEEAGHRGGLESEAPPARSPPTPLPPPARRAPAAPPRRRRERPVELLSTAEQEAQDALWAAAHFHD